MNVQVFRTSASSYQAPNFITKEQGILEKIRGVKYIKSLKEMSSEIPFVLITNSHSELSEVPETILEKTALVIHPNSGFDNLDQDLLRSYDIPVILGNPIRSHAVAEYILSCIFKEFSSVPNHSHWDNSRIWERKLLRDQSVLLLGHGHIGKILRQSLVHLTREIRCFDPYERSPGVINDWSDDLANNIDIVIVAASANKDNAEFVDNIIFNQISSEALIINAARGSLINEEHLKHFLKKNKTAKCYLDVFREEPFPPGQMSDLANLNKTSHIAGVFKKLNHDIISFEYLVLQDFVEALANDKLLEFKSNYAECLLSN